MTTLIHSEYPAIEFDWTDVDSVHVKVSECFVMNGKNYINGKKSKKLQMLYKDYQKIHGKVSRAKFGIEQSKIQERNEKMAEANIKNNMPNSSVESFGKAGSGPGPEAGPGPGAGPEDIPDSWEDLF